MVLFRGRMTLPSVERRVKRITKRLVMIENQRLMNTVPILLDNKTSSKSRIFQSIVVVTCLAACVCQIWLRFAYYLKGPVRMDVFYEEVGESEMPVLTLCTRDTEAFVKYLRTHPLRTPRPCYGNLVEPVSNCKESSEMLWNLLDTKTIIRDAFIAKSNKRLTNMTFGTLNVVTGSCTKIFSDRKVQFGNPSVRTHVLLNYPTVENDTACQSPVLQATVQLKDSKLIELPSVITFAANRKTIILFEIHRYEFLNKSSDVCVEEEANRACVMTCYYNMLLSSNDTCRLPYEESNRYLPYCNCSRETAVRNTQAMMKLAEFSPFKSCQCTRACTMTELITFAYSDITKKEYIEVYTQSNIFRKLVEKQAYNIISLLCDIGGNFNLYFGLSVLSIADLIMRCWEFRQNKIKMSQISKSNNLQKKVFHIFKTEITERRQPKSCEKSYFNIKSGLKYGICILSVVLTTYQIYDRVDYYFNYPISISIKIVNDKKIQLPAIVTCYLPQIIHVAKEKFSRRKNVTCNNVELLDLLDEPSDYAHSIEKLWDDTSTIQHFMKLPDPTFTYGNWSSHSTIHGICTKSELDVKNYGLFVSITTLFAQPTHCGCYYNVFIVPVGNPLDLRNYISLPCVGNTFTKFVKQTQKRVFTPKVPCASRSEATECSENCFKNKSMTNISCRFPHISPLALKLCNSSQSAKQAKHVYLDAYMNTNPLLDCHCYPKCEETIYFRQAYHDYKENVGNITAARYNMRSNVREIITQNLSFSLTKLFCDIGSNLGIMLGMSVFSFVYLTQKVIYNLANKLNI